MAWTEPKEDWEMGDAPSNGDFNRIEKNAKHIFDMIGVVGGIATLGADGKVPQAQLPAAVEIKTIRIPSTSIALNEKITKTATFDYYHKAAIVVAKKKSMMTGILGVIINASEGISDVPAVFSATEYDGEVSTYVAGKSLNGNIFGSWVGFELAFSNKTFTFSLTHWEGAATTAAQADVNIIAL